MLEWVLFIRCFIFYLYYLSFYSLFSNNCCRDLPCFLNFHNIVYNFFQQLFVQQNFNTNDGRILPFAFLCFLMWSQIWFFFSTSFFFWMPITILLLWLDNFHKQVLLWCSLIPREDLTGSCWLVKLRLYHLWLLELFIFPYLLITWLFFLIGAFLW